MYVDVYLSLMFVPPNFFIIKFSLSVCDPVMGDEGKLYVPPELVAVYREKVILFDFLKTTSM